MNLLNIGRGMSILRREESGCDRLVIVMLFSPNVYSIPCPRMLPGVSKVPNEKYSCFGTAIASLHERNHRISFRRYLKIIQNLCSKRYNPFCSG